MKEIILIGTGPMAVDYCKVIQSMKISLKIIGRGETSAQLFFEKTGMMPVIGGIETYISTNSLSKDSYVIIATGTENLMSVLKKVVQAGAGKVLIEKPAAISIEELLDNEKFFEAYDCDIFIAYNRRFYASVIEAKRLIDIDGGLQSMHFEFTEWAHKIEPLQKAAGVKENWFFANSTHVVDLAFFIAGNPVEWNCFSKGGALSWHKKTNFSGAGITDKNVIFSYLSNWESAGRWAIELLTNKRRIYLKPLEGIDIQLKGAIVLQPHSFDDQSDKDFKPGLYKQVEAFWNDDLRELCSLEVHVGNAKNNYLKILG
jgi:predicted dehydrogenase